MAMLGSLAIWTFLLTPMAFFFYKLVEAILRSLRMWNAVCQFPGDKPHWFWGSLLQFPTVDEERLAYDRRIAAKYSRCSGFHIGRMFSFLQVRHPETVKIILKSSEPKPTAGGVYGFGLPWIGEGLLLSSGQKWARNRRLLTPAFHFDVLKPYLKVNNDCSEILLGKMDAIAANGKVFECFTHLSMYTFDVILRCAMSYETDVQIAGENHPYLQAISRLADLWVNRFLTPWMHFDFLYWLSQDGREFRKHCSYVHSVSEEIINKRKLALQSDHEFEVKKYMDFLDILLSAKDADGKGLTFEEIRNEVDTFMFEGHDTTASGISWTLYSLAQHPEYGRRCREEVDETLQGRDSDEILWEDLPKLKYLTQCIKEAMRLHNPVPHIHRQLTKDTEIDGKILPKGSMVNVQVYSVHHNPDVWEDHMEYRPSRFDPENIDKMDSFAFIPFSAGPRNCIGQHFAMHEMKTIVARILRRYDLTLAPDSVVAKKAALVMRAETGIPLKLTRRQH